jgi:hypothetical protein
MSFIKPVKDGKLEKKFSSEKVEITSYENDTVISPYDGGVAQYDANACGGFLKIEHNVDGKTYYSNFCNIINVPRPVQTELTKVYKKTKLGEINGKTLVYWIEDERKSKKSVESFLSDKKEDKEKDKKEDKEKDKKDSETKCSSGQEYNSLTKKCETKQGSKEINKLIDKADPITDLLIKGITAPFKVASDMFDTEKKKEERKKREEERARKEEEKRKKKEKEEKEKQNKLNEEINRIKQLLK